MKYDNKKNRKSEHPEKKISYADSQPDVPEFLKERHTTSHAVPSRDMQKAKVAKKRRRRRKKKYFLHYILIFILLSATFITLSLTVLFNVKSIEVTGNENISKEEIISLTGIENGQNLFRINLKSIEDKILNKYIKVDKVKVTRTLPNTLSIDIEIAKPDIVAVCNKKYYSISKNGKIMEISLTAPKEGVRVVGLDVSKNKVGSYIDTENDAYKLVSKIKDVQNSLKIDNITAIDLSNQASINIYYGESFIIKLGTDEDLEDKIYSAYSLITTKLSDTDKGTVDVSLDNGTYYFRPAEKIDIP